MQDQGSKARVKLMNRLAVLNAVREHGQIGRAEIADLTHLSRASVTYITAGLLDEGWIRVQDKGMTTSQGGRPPTLLEFSPESIYTVVVMLGAEQISVNVGNANAESVYRLAIDAHTEATPAELVTLLANLIQKAIRESQIDGNFVRGVVVGVPGLVDPLGAVVQQSEYYPKLQHANLSGQLQVQVHLPVLVENETRLIGWGEKRFGLGRGRSSLVCLNISRSIGACVILEDRMLVGASYSAAQFGHMTVDVNGPPCPCGNRGCWERVASHQALLERARTTSSDFQSVDDVLKAYADGDPHIRVLMGEWATQVGVGTANIVNIINPDVIVLHGKVLNAANGELLRAVQRTVAERALRLPSLNVQIAVSELGERAGLAGGVSLVVRRTLDASVLGQNTNFYL